MKFSHHAVGHAAEVRGARYLEHLGFHIIELNWRTRLCEIDIIARKQDCMYFVEVKYRASNKWGSGVEQITSRKLRQIRFAADYWLVRHKTSGGCRLAVLGIVGSTFRLEVLDC